ncbi:MAG: amidophosphoribosyltransferase [Acidimicrobiia bacterium]
MKVGEACGVFGVYAPGQNAAQLCYFGLFALQHRGQESAGIATSDGQTLTVYKDLGLVAQVFSDASLHALEGHVGIGHTRYSTTGSNRWENSQPANRQVGQISIALGHNGNLTNTADLSQRYPVESAHGTSDSAVMLAAIAEGVDEHRSDDRGLEIALASTLPSFEGAFSLVVMDQGRLFGVRDPHGFRPLCLGRLPETVSGKSGWVLASETAALDIIGASFVREVSPGEMVIIDATGLRSRFPFPLTDPKLCVFEFVYCARPDSILNGRNVHGARTEMGRTLAREHPVEADVVVPVPESGIPAAQGFASVSAIPYADGLVKNRYIGRTFIEPNQLLRDRGVKLKLNPIAATLAGKRVVLIDDSIVRGSTTRQLVALVREAGAREVHLRISSPPYRWPCYYGMDTSDRSTLIAARLDIDEVCRYVGADSLGYLSLEGLLAATGSDPRSFCHACLSAEYPTDVEGAQGKFWLEEPIIQPLSRHPD